MNMNPLDTVRIGIVGPSWWVNFWHLPALEAHPDAEIIAVCGASERDTSAIKAKYGASARYYAQSDLDSMLANDLLDGVIVCTPNDLHYPVSLAALRAGKHVLCEKPLAMNAGQAQELAETARARRLIGMTNFPYRDNPALGALRERLASGYVGMPLHVSGAYWGGFGLGRPPGWRGLRDRSGAGILADLGSHLIDLARFALNAEFASVCAHNLTALWGEPDTDAPPTLIRTEDARAGARNDDACAFLAEFASGAQGSFQTSWVAYQGVEGQHQALEIFGTAGRLHWQSNFTGTFLRGMKSETGGKWETLSPGEQTSQAASAGPSTNPPRDINKETLLTGREAPSVDGGSSPDATAEIAPNEDLFRPGRLSPANTTYRWIEAIRMGDRMVTPSLDDGWRAQQVIDTVLQAGWERRWIDLA